MQHFPNHQLTPELAVAVRLASSLAAQCAPHELEDARAAALLGFVEAARRYDPARGALTTFAFTRMRGRAIELRRNAQRLHRLRQATGIDAALPAGGAAAMASAELDVRRAVAKVEDKMSSGEMLVLEGVYGQGQTLRATAGSAGVSEHQLQRAHDKLVARLRKELERRPVRAGAGATPG
jgi:RNA polymerase sigma factor (sigma-70 family)